MGGENVDGPAFSPDVERDFRIRPPRVRSKALYEQIDDRRVLGVEEPVEAFAVPSQTRVEAVAERFRDLLEMGERDLARATSFHSRHGPARHAGASRKILLPPPAPDAKRANLQAEPNAVHLRNDVAGHSPRAYLTGFGPGLGYHRALMSTVTARPEEALGVQPEPPSEPSREAGTNALIHARRLTKRFGSFVAVDAIEFDVARGESFGFLGPNGAGKTSTMRMIGCVSPVTDGTLRVLGLDPTVDAAAIKSRLGVVPQQDTLDMELTVRENLIIYGRYFDLSRAEARRRADELLEFVQLTDRANSQVEPLSGGMKRRLTIARSLINEPDLLLLDEPTTGLDPQARHLLWDRLYRLKQQGKTLILTTHYMDEAEQLCDRLVVMDKARIVAEGSPRQLIDAYSTREVVELRFPPGVQETLDGRLEGIADRIEALPDRVLLYADDGEAAVAATYERGLRPETVLVRRSTLEDVFLRLTGRSLIE
jgi:lipooligosaccharide transport system ATP-binding protein